MAVFRGAARFFCALVCMGTVTAAVALATAGYWLRQEDAPAPVDAMVVLGGDYRRPIYAADLFRRGYAPQVYVGRVREGADQIVPRRYGMSVPSQELVYYRILIEEGVPLGDIRLYGDVLASTRDEAQQLAVRLGSGPGRLLVVTSPSHTLRAGLIFRALLPGWEVLVCGAPQVPFPVAWWTSREAAREVLLESAKLVFFLLGGSFPDAGFTGAVPSSALSGDAEKEAPSPASTMPAAP